MQINFFTKKFYRGNEKKEKEKKNEIRDNFFCLCKHFDKYIQKF